MKYEVGNALLFGKKIASDDFEELMDIFYSLPLTFITWDVNLANSTYKLSVALGITYYDASFLSVAKLSDGVLVTENIKHQGKSKEGTVKPLAKY